MGEFPALLYPPLYLLAAWLALYLARQPYDMETGKPTLRLEPRPMWLLGLAALGVGLFKTFGFLIATIVLTFMISLTFLIWDANRPEKIRAIQKEIQERKANHAAAIAAAEAADKARREQEAYAANLRAEESMHPSVEHESYKSSAPKDITETARKLAEQLRSK